MKKAFLNSLLLAILLHVGKPLLTQPADTLTIAFYNVENLFHPSDDSLTRDDEFTPQGQRYWSFYRYREKSNRMAKAILSLGKGNPPAVIGLAEVENKQTVDDLTQSAPLRKSNYKTIHFESPDRRGIDVAAMYRPDFIALDTAIAIPVTLKKDPSYVTRDILYLRLIPLAWRDTLHVFFNHWPSRYGGQAQSEPKRKAAAATLKVFTDSILKYQSKASIIIAGDFNDEWTNESLLNVLAAKEAGMPSRPNDLINLMASQPANEGSHRYRGTWSFLDQVVVSQALFSQNGYTAIVDQTAFTHQPTFLLEKDEKYPGVKPFRTFVGFKYQAGFSDHLPVYIKIYER
jgi:predicted extracellular nuclease